MRTSRTLVIAEVGVNHNGDVEFAHRLIDVSADAGADVVKFQTFDPEQLVSAAGLTADYQLQSTGRSNQRDMLAGLALPSSAWAELADHCRDRAVEFLSTAFDWRSLEALVELGLRRIKIPSGEVDNLRFISAAASIGLPLIVSTGTSAWEDVDRAVASCRTAADVTLLHCVSLYPAPPDTTNLAVIPAMRERYGLPIGWSDHTLGSQSAVMAVALGATVIEKHITLDRSMPGPDHAASASPAEFSEYVAAIRLAELMNGVPDKRVSPAEQRVARAARRSHHAAHDLTAGTQLSEEDSTLLRPGIGAPAWWDITGMTLRVDVPKGAPIEEQWLRPADSHGDRAHLSADAETTPESSSPVPKDSAAS
jgi:N,N'-diacetyllegionaminate synthase